MLLLNTGVSYAYYSSFNNTQEQIQTFLVVWRGLTASIILYIINLFFPQKGSWYPGHHSTFASDMLKYSPTSHYITNYRVRFFFRFCEMTYQIIDNFLYVNGNVLDIILFLLTSGLVIYSLRKNQQQWQWPGRYEQYYHRYQNRNFVS